MRAVVMNAVRAGVPVLGGNLPRAEMRAAMADSQPGRAHRRRRARVLADAVRSGHCQLLPAAQEPGMVRIQIARDLALARVGSRGPARRAGGFDGAAAHRCAACVARPRRALAPGRRSTPRVRCGW